METRARPSSGRAGSRFVLIEPVYDDHQPTCPFFRLSGSVCQQAQPYADSCAGDGWRLPAGRAEGVELIDHGIEEGIAVGLTGKAAGDEERHDVHPDRGWVTNHDASADLPDHGPACHQT